MSDWHAHGVDQLAAVNAYYEGVASVCATTLRPPAAPFFRVQAPPVVEGSEGSEGAAASRSNKKRKRQRQQQRHLDELLASGKFVPLDDDVVEALERAHACAIGGREWVVTLGNGSRAEEDAEDVNRGEDDAGVVATTGDSHTNSSVKIIRIAHNGEVCLMPPHSKFLQGDVRLTLPAESSSLGKFQFIVMDPPWENKSVDRKRCYKTFHHRELLKLPIEKLSRGGDAKTDGDEGCVLAIWVTNRPTYSTFILDELLAHWGFTFHAIWYWLKVCTTGELVSPLRASHRLPVEKLIVATRASSRGAQERLGAQLGNAPRVVVSVPLRHSWKPPPESFFDAETLAGRNLELFARELRPRFVSAGHEPLKFQTLAHFNVGNHPRWLWT